ncbi:MAG: response regulator transcription factor [Ekhidna sp.]
MNRHVLLAEDDEDLRNVLAQYLKVFDFDVTSAKDGEEALRFFENNAFDICVLDVMMPKMDGFTLAEKLIDIHPEMPFIFLTARTLKEDKIRGLKLGADDYIEKPFEADELVLRLNNIMKRHVRSSSSDRHEVLGIGSYALHPARLTLTRADEIQNLTKKEVALIQFLVANKNRVVKREDILSAVWKSSDFFSGRSMDVFISRLRKYFKDDSNISIESIRGVGLEFRVC